MKPLEIAILTGFGTKDILFIEIDKPTGLQGKKGNANVTLEVAETTGESYVKEHFPNVPYTVVDTKYANQAS
jgi:hypothetical protein